MQRLLRGGLTEPGGTTAALWSYIHPVLKYSEFGGKTGTSNNHSDAWFVGVTPKLVAGGWVGGEYRSIHFRTGALGQGSRTALPIFGNFIQDVLLDDRFAKYREKFPKEPLEDIDKSCYICDSYYPVPDSLSTDSAGAAGDSLGVLLQPGMEQPTETHAPGPSAESEADTPDEAAPDTEEPPAGIIVY